MRDDIVTAIESDNGAHAESLLRAAPEMVDAPLTNDGDRAIHLAAWRGLPELVEYLVANGADIDAQGDNGRTALHYAAHEGKVAVAKVLLRLGARRDLLDAFGQTAAMTALRSRHGSDELSVLLDLATLPDRRLEERLLKSVNDGDTRIVERILGESPGVLGSITNTHELVRLAIWIVDRELLRRDCVTVDCVDEVVREKVGLLELLLRHGASPNAPRPGVMGPVHYAAQLPTEVPLRLLAEWGADVSAVTDSGISAQTLAEKHPDGRRVLDFLKSYRPR